MYIKVLQMENLLDSLKVFGMVETMGATMEK